MGEQCAICTLTAHCWCKNRWTGQSNHTPADTSNDVDAMTIRADSEITYNALHHSVWMNTTITAHLALAGCTGYETTTD